MSTPCKLRSIIIPQVNKKPYLNLFNCVGAAMSGGGMWRSHNKSEKKEKTMK